MNRVIIICIFWIYSQSSYGFHYPSLDLLNNNPVISVCKADSPIQIDGKDLEWNSADSIHFINHLYLGNPSSPADLSGQFQVKWDDNYLYVFGKVNDNSFVNDSPLPWHDDSFEIYIDGGNEKDTLYDANDHQLMFRYNDLNVFDNSSKQINPTGVDFKMIPQNGSYAIEVRIAWSYIGIPTPTTGTQIGLDIHLNDDDATIMPSTPIPTSDWTVYFDPNDPNSYNQNRSDCQLIAAGNRFNTGDVTDVIQAGSGYGLSFDSNSEIHSFPVNGETLRFGVKPVTGLCNATQAFIHRHVWLNDGSYDESQEQPNGINMSTTFPGIDRTYFDGTRTQMSCIPTASTDPVAIKVGPDGDMIRVATTWRIESWMLAADQNGFLHHLHEPGHSSPSQLSTLVGDGGFLTIITRDTIAPFQSGDQVPVTTRAKIPITSADVGDWWSIVYSYRMDPTGGGFLNVWLDKGTGSFQQIVNITGSIGYRFAEGDINNELFYPILVNYNSWHRSPISNGGVVNNWDPTYGNLREIYFAYSGIMVNGFIPALEIMAHANYYTCGTGTGGAGAIRDNNLAWSDTTDAAWYNPSAFGTITLGDCAPVYIEPNVSLWLEGAYDGNTGLLQTELHQKQLLPSRQPYHNPPWNYPGLEGYGWIASDYPVGSVDWVLVSFRTTPSPSSTVARAAGILLENGTVYFPNDKILDPIHGSAFYILVEHRNHIGALSPQPIQVVGSTLTYDFRNADSYISGAGFGQQYDSGTANWMLYAGDGDQTSNLMGYDINGNDKAAWGLRNGIFSSYESVDFNLDGDVSGLDRIFWDYNNGIFSSLER